MLGSIVCSDTTFRTRTRAMSRLGALCGVFGVLLVSWGGFFQGCQPPPAPNPCETASDCDDDNGCTTDTCDVTSGDCAHTDLCDADHCLTISNAAGQEIKACVECINADQCDPGQVCDGGQCVAEAACTADADCAAGQVCTNGQCVDEAGCTVDGDCAAGQVCTNGACVAGGTGGDPVAGLAFYTTKGCAVCHGVDATGGIGPNIQGESAAEIFAVLSGATAHTGGTVAGATEQDALDLEAWLGSL